MTRRSRRKHPLELADEKFAWDRGLLEYQERYVERRALPIAAKFTLTLEDVMTLLKVAAFGVELVEAGIDNLVSLDQALSDDRRRAKLDNERLHSGDLSVVEIVDVMCRARASLVAALSLRSNAEHERRLADVDALMEQVREKARAMLARRQAQELN
jgi:hypothetical protein